MSKKILVIGDYCLDEFVYCKCERLSPEAPVPVAMPIRKETNDGMAGNLKANLTSLNNSDIDINFLRSLDPIVKTRYIDEASKQTLLRVDSHDFSDMSVKISDLDPYKDVDAIVIADYKKGFVTEDFLKELGAKYRDSGVDLYLDTKKIIREWGSDYIIKINDLEFNKTIEANNGNIWYKHLIVTLGKEGARFYDHRSSIIYHETEIVNVSEVSGAGDTFLAALVTARTIEQKPWPEALSFANKAAIEAIKRVGVVAVKREWIKK